MSVASPFKDTSRWDALAIVVATEAGGSQSFWWDNTDISFGGDVSNEWDVKKAKGVDGATAKDKGYKATKATCSLLLWTEKHFETYVNFVKSAKPRPGKDPKPIIQVYHPQLQIYSLEKFRMESFTMIDFEEVDQWTAKFSLIEYIPEPKPVKKGKEISAAEGDSRFVMAAIGLPWAVGKVIHSALTAPDDPSKAPAKPSSSTPEPPLPSPWAGPAMNK